jgi:hypothetical protein
MCGPRGGEDKRKEGQKTRGRERQRGPGVEAGWGKYGRQEFRGRHREEAEAAEYCEGAT